VQALGRFFNPYLASAAFDLYPLPCFFKSFASSFQKFPCLVKLVVIENAYGTFAFFRTFLTSSFCWEIRKQANLVSCRVFVLVFLLCSSWMYFLMGLSQAINLFELCLWFIAKKTRVILWKLYKPPWMKIEEAPSTTTWMRLRTNWFILTADFWLDETLSPRVKKLFRGRDWMKRFPYAFLKRSILSENLSKYEIKHFFYPVHVDHSFYGPIVCLFLHVSW